MKQCYIDAEHRAIADLVPATSPPYLVGVTDNALVITRINVPRQSRGQGIASKLLHEICNDADHDHVTLVLEISPSDGLNYDQLANWYFRNGFRLRATGYWVRRPNVH